MVSLYISLLVTLMQVLCWIQDTRSECLDNYRMVSSNRPWTDRGSVHYQTVIAPNYRGSGGIKDWTLRINFTAPLAEDLETWNMLGYENSIGKTSVVLTAEYDWNQKINRHQNFEFIAAFEEYQLPSHLKCIEFCGVLDSGENTCDLGPPLPPMSSTSRPTAKAPTTGIVLTTSTTQVCPRDVLEMGSVDTPKEGKNGRFDAHWVILAPKRMKNWKLTFTTDKPLTKVRPYESKLVRKVIGPNTYTFRNSRNQKGIPKGQTFKVGFEAFWGYGPRPRILSAVVNFTSFNSLPNKLVLCPSVMPTGEPDTTAMPLPKTTALPKPRTTKMPNSKTTAPPKPGTTKMPNSKTTALPKPGTTKMPNSKTTAKPKPATTIPHRPATTAMPGSKTTAMPHPSTVEPPKCTPKYNYSEVLEKSLLFYEAQRSGKLPANNRIKWRRDSALNDKTQNGADLTGGYYDAGDYVKFGFPMAASITNLAWGMIEFKRGYVSAGQYQYGLDALKWGTDYFIKCHTEKEKFYGQVGDGDVDHAYWGRPEDMTMARPSFSIDGSKPGSELAGETAAALAATSIVFYEAGDRKYAATLLNHAKQLFDFANTRKGKYSDSIPNAAKFYNSWSGFDDELAWACLWLYKATNDMTYYNKFKELYSKGSNNDVTEYSWDNKWAGVHVLAATMKMTQTDSLAKLRRIIQTTQRTPMGLIFVQQWGPNRHAANIAFLSLVASKVKDSKFYTDFARQQIHYMLGDTGRSFVVGFGVNPPKRPHHRSSSCPDPPAACTWNEYNSPAPNPHTLYGALVGGPDANDNYADERSDFIKNEVAMDYNAGFQSAIAGLTELAFDGKCDNKKSMERKVKGKLYEQLEELEEVLKESKADLKSLMNAIRNP